MFKDLICFIVRLEISRCCGKIKKVIEELNEEKIKLEFKVLICRVGLLLFEKVF